MIQRFTLRAAVYLLLIKDKKVLLLRRRNTGWADGNYGLISGHLDGNETVIEAMVREAHEEAGITIYPHDLQVTHVMHRNAEVGEYVDFFLVAKAWKGNPQNTEPEKCDDMQWFPLDELPKNIISSVKQAIEQYSSGQIFSEYGWKDYEKKN